MYQLLISGSRAANRAMVELAARAVERVKENDWAVVVGDASGIDYAVILACCEYNVEFNCYGITRRPRNFCCKAHADCYHECSGDFLARDRVMADIADRGFFIHNGTSRGTMYTYKYMQSLGKPVDIRSFGNAGRSIKGGLDNWQKQGAD